MKELKVNWDENNNGTIDPKAFEAGLPESLSMASFTDVDAYRSGFAADMGDVALSHRKGLDEPGPVTIGETSMGGSTTSEVSIDKEYNLVSVMITDSEKAFENILNQCMEMAKK